MTVSAAALRVENELDFDVQYPPLPRSIAEVSALLASGEEAPDPERLVQIACADPALATTVLRRANSAYYGARRPVGDLRQAVVLLGFQEVCNLVLASSMVRLRDVVETGEQADILERLLRTSIAAAYFSQLLASALAISHRQAGFATGLLHNVGRLVFLHNVPESYEALYHGCAEGEAPEAREEHSIFGVGHSELGYRAAAAWGLPGEIATAIRHYVEPGSVEQAGLRELACVTSVAASAADELCRFAAAAAGGASTGRWRFQPPAHLAAIEQEVGASASVLVGLVEGHASQALKYVRAMTFN